MNGIEEQQPRGSQLSVGSGTDGVPNDAEAKSALASRVLAAVGPVSRAAASFVGFFGWTAALSILSAVAITGSIFLPFNPFAIWKLLAALLTVAVLSLPGAVLFIFRVGLTQIVALPAKLLTASSGIAASSRQTYSALSEKSGGRLSGLLALVKSLVEVRGVLMESRNLLFSGTAIVRVANPIVLVVVLASTVLSGLLVVIAVILGAITVF